MNFAWPLPATHPKVPSDSMCIEPWFGRGGITSAARDAGLAGHYRIVAVGGERPGISGREFMVWFRQRYDPGDEVVLTVLDRGEEREIRYVLSGG